MSVERQKVMIGQLSLGMYVAELDRSWLETPFKLQGFMLKNQEQLIELSSLCQFVYIDIEKGIKPRTATTNSYSPSTNKDKASYSIPSATHSFTYFKKKSDQYKRQADFYKVAKQVHKVQDHAQQALKAVDDCLRKGQVFDQRPVQRAAIDIVSSVIDNPDIMSWLGRIHENDDFTHDHCVRSATWACVFGRHLGLKRKDMAILVQAVLLKDVGKTRLPKHIIIKTESELSGEELKLYQKYVSLSVALLKQVKGLDVGVVDVIHAHRECYDGSGFPNGLKGDEISLLAIIAHIASIYDLLVNPRNEAEQSSPSDAMRHLHMNKNTLFQEDLVIEFNQALGVFPAGSLVELNTGALAVVIEQNDNWKLRPVISLLTNEGLMPLRTPKKLDLLTQARAPLHDGDKADNASLPELYIVKDLPANQCSENLLSLKKDIFIGKRSMFSRLAGS
ncbi:MAG: DUF3391 domain-containing protein [Sinobacterium sp.]|nr:DUF3391 domain-containing protein [Sinobacterium sp.]